MKLSKSLRVNPYFTREFFKNKLKISIINQLVLITIAIKAAYHVGQLQHEAATEYKQYQEEIKQKQ